MVFSSFDKREKNRHAEGGMGYGTAVYSMV
jgi:hypothetical protein